MTTTEDATVTKKRADDDRHEEQIPVDDVPAFGVQLKFAKRTILEWLADWRKAPNGSHKRT